MTIQMIQASAIANCSLWIGIILCRLYSKNSLPAVNMVLGAISVGLLWFVFNI